MAMFTKQGGAWRGLTAHVKVNGATATPNQSGTSLRYSVAAGDTVTLALSPASGCVFGPGMNVYADAACQQPLTATRSSLTGTSSRTSLLATA